MASYLIAQVQVSDEALYQEYRQVVGASLEKHGGKILAIASEVDVVEGDWPATHTVVVEFETIEAARTWYASDDYAEPLAIRLRAATTNLVFVDGV